MCYYKIKIPDAIHVRDITGSFDYGLCPSLRMTLRVT